MAKIWFRNADRIMDLMLDGMVGPAGEFIEPAGRQGRVDIFAAFAIPAANAAPGTTVLGVLDGQETLAVFAVTDVGGVLAFNPNLGYADTNQARLVHIFTNENGSGGARRVFNALTDLGRILFVRAAKWAMGETLEPYQGLGLIRVSKLGSQQIQLEWDGTPTRLYKILGTRNLAGPSDQSNWQTVAQDIAVQWRGLGQVRRFRRGSIRVLAGRAQNTWDIIQFRYVLLSLSV